MDKKTLQQKILFEKLYDLDYAHKFNFHTSNDKLTRYLRDRRLLKSMQYLISIFSKDDLLQWSVLIVCGGVGGEGIFFKRFGFNDVTVSDFSVNSLIVAKQLDSSLHILELNAEALELTDNSYDLVVVQDGLHHLPRPSLGLTEMLRVSKKAIIVIEPYDSLVGNLLGTEWETHGGTTNYVYRWNKTMVEQTVKSYLLKEFSKVKVIRIWDHNVLVGKVAKIFSKKFQLFIAKCIYSLFSLIKFSGNMMIGIVVKDSLQ